MALLVRRRRAASLSNYAFLAGFVAIVSIGALILSGGQTGCLLQQASFGLVGDESTCASVSPPVPSPDPPPPEGNRAPQVADRVLPRVNLGSFVSIQMQGTDPDGDPLTWTLGGGTLPPGLILDSDGLLSGIPTEGGLFSFTVVAADSYGLQGSGQITLVINRPPVILSAGLLTPPLVAGSTLSIPLVGTDPDGDVLTWSIVAGDLPPGLSFTPDGIIFGTPTGPGATFTVRAQDPDGLAATAEIRLNAAPIFTTPATLPPALAGQPLAQTLGASDPDGQPIVVSLTAGVLPDGVLLSPDGLLTGTPVAGGVFVFTAQAQDPDGATATRVFTLEVGGAPTFLTLEGLLGSYEIGTNATFTIQAEDSIPGSLTYALTPDSTLPEGLMLAADGTISGVPLSSGTTFTVRVTNSATGLFAERTFRLNAVPIFSGDPTIDAALDTPFSATVGAADPDGGPVSVVLIDGTLPDGVSLSSDGVLSGTPYQYGAFPLTVRATDEDGASTTRVITLAVAAPPSFLTPAGLLGSYEVGAWTTIVLVASDPLGEPLTFSLAPGSSLLPEGLSLGTDGLISGVPTGAGTTFTVRVTNASGFFRDRTFRLNARPVFVSEPGLVEPGYVPGTPFSTTFLTSDPDGQPLVVSLVSGQLPPGLSLSTDGVLEGIATDPTTTYAFVLRVTDPDGAFSERAFLLSADLRPRWITPAGALQTITQDVNSTQFVLAESPAGLAITYSLESGALPAGITLHRNLGQLTGATTEAAGTVVSFTLRASDSVGRFQDQSFTILVNGRPRFTQSNFTVGPLPTGVPISIQLPVQDAEGIAGLTCTQVTPGAIRLPPGLSMEPGCVLTGVPTAPYNGWAYWQVSDGLAFGPRSLRLRVNSYDPNFEVAPFTFANLTYPSFTAPSQDSNIVTIGGTFTEVLTARLRAPRPATLWIAGVARGTGTEVSFPISNGQTIQVRGIQNPSNDEFDAVEEYIVEILGPGDAVLYETTILAMGPTRVIEPTGLIFSAIPTQSLGATGINTSVPAISGFNDVLSLRVDGSAGFQVRLGTNSTCTLNPVVATSAAGETVNVPVGVKGQATNTLFHLCLTGLSAPNALSASNVWTVSLQDPLSNTTLREHNISVSTSQRDPVPTIGTLVTSATFYNLNATFSTRGGSLNTTTPINAFNVPIRLEVSGPRPVTLRIYDSASRSCGSTTGQQQVVGPSMSPQATIGTTITTAGGSNNLAFCLEGIAPAAFDQTDTYEIRAVDPQTNAVVATRTIYVRSASRNPIPTINGPFGTGNTVLPYAISTNQTVVRTVSGFNTPLRVALHLPNLPGVAAQLRLGNSSICTNNPVVATGVPGQTILVPTLQGTVGGTNAFSVCLVNVTAPGGFSQTAIYSVLIMDPENADAIVGTISYAAPTVARNAIPSLTNGFVSINGFNNNLLPGAAIGPSGTNTGTVTRFSSFNAALTAIFTGPRPFTVHFAQQGTTSFNCDALPQRAIASPDPETGGYIATIPYIPHASLPEQGSGFGNDATANSILVCVRPANAPPSYGTTDVYHTTLIDPRSGTVVFSSTSQPSSQFHFTTVPLSHTPSDLNLAATLSSQNLNTILLRQDASFDGLTAPTLFEVEASPGLIARLLLQGPTNCPPASGGFPDAATESQVYPTNAVTPRTSHSACLYIQTQNGFSETGTVTVRTRNPNTSEITLEQVVTVSTKAANTTFTSFPTFADFTVPAGPVGETVTYFSSNSSTGRFWYTQIGTVNVPYVLRISGPRPLDLYTRSGAVLNCATASGATNRNPNAANTVTFVPGAGISTYTLPWTAASNVPTFALCIQNVRRPAPGQTDTYTVEAIEVDRLTGLPTNNVLRSHTFTITAP